jgi:hypothetical protein
MSRSDVITIRCGRHRRIVDINAYGYGLWHLDGFRCDSETFTVREEREVSRATACATVAKTQEEMRARNASGSEN